MDSLTTALVTALLVVMVVGLVVLVLLPVIAMFTGGRGSEMALSVAGTPLPPSKLPFDLDMRYDLTYASGGTVPDKYTAVRVVGRMGRSAEWLVIEFADLRRAYLRPDRITLLSETAATPAVSPTAPTSAAPKSNSNVIG
jgi:hypothetical protein